MDDHNRLAEPFEAHRSHLRAVAYRMLGSLSEADDAVQETWLRFNRTDTSSVENLAAWLTTVVEVGPSGLTLAAVAERVGVSAPALTQRFGSKHGLLVAFATREATSIADIFAAARATHADPLTALVTTLAGLPSAITTREGLANNLAFLQMDLTDPELRSRSVFQSRALRADVAALVTEAIQAGQLTAATSPETLAADLYATYCGAMVTWAIDGTGALPDWLGQHLERTVGPHRTTPAGEPPR